MENTGTLVQDNTNTDEAFSNKTKDFSKKFDRDIFITDWNIWENQFYTDDVDDMCMFNFIIRSNKIDRSFHYLFELSKFTVRYPIEQRSYISEDAKVRINNLTDKIINEDADILIRSILDSVESYLTKSLRSLDTLRRSMDNEKISDIFESLKYCSKLLRDLNFQVLRKELVTLKKHLADKSQY